MSTIFFVRVFGIFVLFSSLFPTVSVHAESKMKIGVILALTGPIAPVGNSIKNAVLMADEKLDGKDQVEFLFEDDQFQAKNAVSAAEKLISRDKVSALITFSGSTSAAVSKLAELRKVPMIGITSLSNIGKEKQFVSTLFLGEEQQIATLTAACDRIGAKRVAVVTSIQDALLGLRQKFRDKNLGRITNDEEILPGDTNLGSVATKILAQKPDAVVLFLLPPQYSVLSKYLRDQGFKGKFLGGAPMFNPPEIKAAGGALNGAWLPGPESRTSADFLEKYQAKFHEPCISEGLYGYDTAALLVEAVKSGDIGRYVRDLKNFNGVAGSYPKSRENAFQVPVELREIGAEGQLQKVIEKDLP